MRNQIFSVLISGVILTACGNIEKIANTSAVPDEPQPLPVEISIVDTMRSGVTHTYVGEVEENATIALSFQVGGNIEHVYVHEGDHIKKGQLLASVNKQNARNTYNAAQATLAQAEDGYKRLKQVYNQGSVAEVKWVEMKTNLEKARSMAAIAKQELNNCDLYAPCNGVIGECKARTGTNTLLGQSILTILDVERVQVSFTVPETEISSIALGDKGKISIAALGDTLLAGEITDRSLTANKVSHSYTVKIALDNQAQRILPGMVCKVYLSDTDNCGYVVPANAIQTRPEGLNVWLYSNGKAVRHTIKTNQFVKNGTLVSEGLHSGDTIITSGYQKLYEGAKVQINTANE